MDQIKFYNAVARASKNKSNAQINAAWDRVYARGFGRNEESTAVLLAFREEIKL